MLSCQNTKAGNRSTPPWFPELSAANDSLWILDEKIKSLGPEKGVEFWLTNLQINGAKESYDVPKIPRDDHDVINPYDELVQMRGTDEGIVIVPKPTP